jgi:hypothetical protein
MLEASLSMVVAFAAYTFYTIAGDEIRANRAATHLGKKLMTEAKPKGETAQKVKNTKTVPKPKTSPRKAKAVKAEESSGLVAVTSDAILVYLSANGSVTLTKLGKELQTDKATVMLAAEKLIKEKAALSIKRGGYPAIALSEN